jgi:mutator protein MutT
VNNKTQVMAAVISRADRFLLCERPAHKRHGGLWEFPGGKVEPGETPLDAVRRELYEELGIEVVAVGEVEFSVADSGSEFVIEFLRASIVGEPQCLEHDSLAWVLPAELLDFPLAPSDRKFALRLLERLDAASASSGTTETSLILLLKDWAQVWGVPDLAGTVEIRFSVRLERSLGRCRPSLGLITLAAELETGDPAALAEVLCHEAAHVAAYRLHGRRAAPHGREWKALVRAAGFEPRVLARESTAPRKRGRPRRRYEHRCEVCQSVRYGGRPVPQWHCAECIAAGLDGVLTIAPHDRPGDA